MALLSTISTFQDGRWALGAAIASFGVGVALYGALVLRRVGVQVGRDHIVLRGPLGNQVVPVAEADRFEIGSSWPWRVWLIRKDGSKVMTTGLGASGVQHRRSMEESRRLVGLLNDLLHQLH